MSTDYARPSANRGRCSSFYLGAARVGADSAREQPPWAWAILSSGCSGSRSGGCSVLRGKGPPQPGVKGAWPALLCAALWLAYVWLQLLPLPFELLQLLSPEAARAHAAAGLAPVAAAPLTLDDTEPWTAR